MFDDHRLYGFDSGRQGFRSFFATICADWRQRVRRRVVEGLIASKLGSRALAVALRNASLGAKLGGTVGFPGTRPHPHRSQTRRCHRLDLDMGCTDA